MTNEGPGGPESVVASKDAAGAWQVSRIYHSYRSPPSPEYPMPPQWPQPAGMGEKQGVFEPGDWTVIHQAGALFRSGDGASARIVSYTPGKACDGTLRIQPAGDGAAVDLYRDWDAIRSFPGWPDGADSVLDRGDGVDRFTFDGTTMAMMFDGAMGGFSFLCREPES